MSHGFERDIQKALEAPYNIPAGRLAGMLACNDPLFVSDLFSAARRVKERCGKGAVLPRGLIETSNVCAKDCFYCGIRRSNDQVTRYCLSEEAIVAAIDEVRQRGYGAVAFQAGEIESKANTAFYERLLARCRGLEVTLSLGEQTEEVYRRWKTAFGDGVLRYLIRIEENNASLYAQLHPTDCSFERRLSCIRTLKRLGYVTGSGVMIGLPNQTVEDLANDIVFFGAERLDMVGMGPYVPDANTPLGHAAPNDETTRRYRFDLALRMIALTRLYMHDINIVAATALEVLDPAGREKGIAAGANVIMPNVTPLEGRRNYALYPGKATC